MDSSYSFWPTLEVIWHRHMKASNDQYKPLSYRPAIILCPKAPKGDELILIPKMTKEYVDVGLIVGDVPEKHSRKGESEIPEITKGQGLDIKTLGKAPNSGICQYII
ncbi:uncharacterized protein FFE2_07911 [Fusarium fujikuroi]|nr:uncharacterized protein FFE2_07911 [Fusarium fujikuroi]SCV33202.1 uncharacterized protein FFFS_03669 [Fusarium fujikuroi]